MLGVLCAGILQGTAAPVETMLHLDFQSSDLPGEWLSGKAPLGPGPMAPDYPGFTAGNQAGEFSGNRMLRFADDGKAEATRYRFDQGDSITLETWVRLRSIDNGQFVVLIAKGRHRTSQYGEMNQNYAMRLQGTSGGTRLGFLFTSRGGDGVKPEWHRWWSHVTLNPQSEWHHLAISYTFGKKDSLRGYIDGQPTTGEWDMGGATDRAPVVDGDALGIGSGYSRSSGVSLDGWLDEVRIHRGIVDAQVLQDRFQFVAPPPPPPPMPVSMLPADKVLVQICEEGVPTGKAWAKHPPQPTQTYEERALGFFREPQKYISTGVREDRANPHLLRAGLKVHWPAGTHRLLLRGRGAARLYINEKIAVETPFPSSSSDGHHGLDIQDDYLDLGPDFRFAPPGNREEWKEYTTQGGEHAIVLETFVGLLVGKNNRRPELGETVAAISFEGSDRWQLIAPDGDLIPYNDAGWHQYEQDRTTYLDQVDAQERARLRELASDYWKQRRAQAQAWLESTPEVEVPALPEGYPSLNPVDHFIGAQAAEASRSIQANQSGTVDFFGQIKPLLESRCLECHQGAKAKGGLRLDSLEAARAGGKSDGTGILPGSPAESSILHRVKTDDEDDIMPPKGDRLSPQEIALLETWIREGAAWPKYDLQEVRFTGLSEDLAFLRRLSLDTVGVPPSEKEIQTFLRDAPRDRRGRAIDRLLKDPRWADQWMGYWQDVLAENPNIINPTLNNSGPFRWWIEESLLDDKPMDLFVTELIRMEGSVRYGGPAGFGIASQNDVPMAAKGIILGGAFLGVELKCARCHDAPGHTWKQKDLFQVAAMLSRKPVEVPKTSSVPIDEIHKTGRKPLIEVTLKPGTPVPPVWPFQAFVQDSSVIQPEHPDDTRDQLAAFITSPTNERFAQVLANRVWERLMGRGLVSKVEDWQRSERSHQELLRWLGRELVRSGYQLKAVARLILESHAYQRAVDPGLREAHPLFAAQSARHLEAEQIVDSLFSATGAPFDLEEVSLDIDSVRTDNSSITLGVPERAWMLASTSNERDRPSLSLPRIQAVASFMEAFGWRGARQDPANRRETAPNVIQPAVLAHGAMGVWLTRLSDRHELTELALEDQTVEALIDRLFLRLLTRKPTRAERLTYLELLKPGYEDRRQDPGPLEPVTRVREKYVSWSNHLDGEANQLRMRQEEQARRGDPPTHRLQSDWRERLEDMIWALVNSPEWIYTP